MKFPERPPLSTLTLVQNCRYFYAYWRRWRLSRYWTDEDLSDAERAAYVRRSAYYDARRGSETSFRTEVGQKLIMLVENRHRF